MFRKNRGAKSSLVAGLVVVIFAFAVSACTNGINGDNIGVAAKLNDADFTLSSETIFTSVSYSITFEITKNKELLYKVACGKSAGLDKTITLSDEDYNAVLEAYSKTDCLNAKQQTCVEVMDAVGPTMTCADEKGSTNSIYVCIAPSDQFTQAVDDLSNVLNEMLVKYTSDKMEPWEICK